MEKRISKSPIWGALILALGAVSPCSVVGGENPQLATERHAEQRAEFQQRLQELDSPYYETRRLAAERLERWLGMPEMAAMLAEQFQQLIVRPELPFEVRWRILIWRTRLPLAKIEPPQAAPAEELERLVCQLDDDSYAVRAGASERLRWMAASDHLAQPIMLVLKRRLDDPLLSEDSYRRLESIRNIAWGIWLTSDGSDWNLPPVSHAQIDDWLNELGQPTKRDLHSAIRRRIARQELMDVLSQDREVPRVKATLEAHLRGKLDPEAIVRLKELLDLTRPALVAESWSGRSQILEQHLVVGQPMYSPGAPNPSHFDRADDHIAHCVSGNSLTPGDYRVGVAFPAPRWHPSAAEAVFALVNLPTPRRQIAYSYYVKTDPAARLAKLSRRTLDALLLEKRLLNDSELGMLGQLDAHEVSCFASRYFLMVDDGMVEEDLNQESSTSRGHLGSHSSRFGAICGQLALDGTREAAPGLLEAIRQKKFMSPTPLGPYRLQWLAALSIARRDPWPDVDAWLAENIDNQETVIIDHAEAAGIGATAAGVLLTRHEERPEAFGLQATIDPQLAEMKLPGFRYAAPDGLQRVRQWWKRQSEIHRSKASAATARPQ